MRYKKFLETIIHLDNGTYSSHLQTLKKDEDELYAMENFLVQVAVVTIQDEVEHEGNTFKGDEVLRIAFAEDSLEKPINISRIIEKSLHNDIHL